MRQRAKLSAVFILDIIGIAKIRNVITRFHISDIIKLKPPRKSWRLKNYTIEAKSPRRMGERSTAPVGTANTSSFTLNEISSKYVF